MAKPIHTKGEELLKLSEIDASDRIRELSSDVMKYIENELAPSIADHGLIQPIVIDQNKKLIAGGCRYTAFKLLQYDKIPVVYREKLTASDSILLELEENLRRRKMRWQETTLGIYKAHQIKKKESSRIHAKWGVRQTGALLGVSHATVGDALIIAEYLIKGDAEILEALTFEKAQQVLLSRKEDAAMKRLASISAQPIIVSSTSLRTTSGPVTDEPTPPAPKPPVILGQESGPKIQLKENQILSVDLSDIIFHRDCHDWFAEQKEESVDHIFTDIPYGIDMDNIEDLEGIEIIREAHDVEENIAQMERFLQGSFKVLREHAYCCFYYTPEYHNYLQDLAKKIGFGVQPWPNLWIKSHGIKNKRPHRVFGKSFDPIMVLWKGQPSLRKPHPRCDYTADGMMEKRRQKNPFAKPFEANKWMLESFAHVGQTVLDPYAGGGSIARTGISLGLRMISVEKDEKQIPYLVESYVQTYRNMLGEQTKFSGAPVTK